MRRLGAFVFTTLDGYFEGPNHDISWHRHGAEENAYAAEGLASGSTLLFGRRTYEMMASYWPTPLAAKNDPTVAAGMNKAEKVVFSRTLKTAAWPNTRLVKHDLVGEVGRLKAGSGPGLTLLGSGSVLTQLADARLIDEYLIMVDPVALGEGSSIFKGLKAKLDLRLTATRTFKSGVVLLSYEALKA